MKKKSLLLFILSAFIYVSLPSFSNGGKALSDENGTGARGGRGGCNCHGPQETPEIGITVELDSAGIPVNRYIGGHQYTIKISGKNKSVKKMTKFGIRLAIVKGEGAGTLAAENAGDVPDGQLPQDCESMTLGSFKVIEHKVPLAAKGTGGQGTVYEEIIPWTAPERGTGEVKIFGVLLAVDDDKTEKGDKWNKITTSLREIDLPLEILGAKPLCVKQRLNLRATRAGGTWSSSNPAIATVSATGAIYGNGSGTTTITYKYNKAEVSVPLVVNAEPLVEPIEGDDKMCSGTKMSLTEKSTGGNWTVKNAEIATVSSSGEVTGKAAGVAEVIYVISNFCGTDRKTKMVTVVKTPNAGSINAAKTELCVDEPLTVTNTATGGVWSCVSEIATIEPSGIVKARAEGKATLYYKIDNDKCPAVAEKVVSFYTKPVEAISGPPEIKIGSVKTYMCRNPGGIWTIDVRAGTGLATINSKGIVNPIRAGETAIVYSAHNGGCWNIVKRKIKIVE